MACAIKKGVNYECTHSHLGEVRSSHQGPRLPPPSRIDGAYLPGLWLPEMVGLRATGPDPVYQQRPADFLDVPCLRHPRGQLAPWRFRMAVRCAAVPGILEQATGNLGGHRVAHHVPRNGHDHSVHAEWLGSGCRISRDGRQRSLPDEGVVLLAVSIYLLKQDVVRVLEADPSASVALSRA